LQPGSVAKVPITFEPSELGEASSTFSVSSSVLATACSSSGSTFTVKLAGSGIALSLVTTPETLDFGNTLIGTAVTETVTLKNQSKTAVAGIVATLGGVDPSAFAIENLPTWLDAGASAEVDLSYRRATDRLGAQHQLPDRLPLANLASQVR
jgi:hypothetical protein